MSRLNMAIVFSSGRVALRGRSFCARLCRIKAGAGRSLEGVFWARVGRRIARKRVWQHPDGEVCAERPTLGLAAAFRLASLASTPPARPSVSDVVITFVSYVLIHFTDAPYLCRLAA